MNRGERRRYYDKGYRDGVKDTKRDSRVPKVIGACVLTATASLHPPTALTVLFLWAVFELTEWRDEQKHHESDPPPAWYESEQ